MKKDTLVALSIFICINPLSTTSCVIDHAKFP